MRSPWHQDAVDAAELDCLRSQAAGDAAVILVQGQLIRRAYDRIDEAEAELAGWRLWADGLTDWPADTNTERTEP